MSEITIGAMARRTGLAVSAIRFYETQRLIAPNRNAGGQRRYPKSDIRRLSFVMIAQKLGFTIAQIRAQLEKLPDARTPTEKDWERMAKGFRTELDQKIATLQTLRDDLGGCIGCGCLSMKRCALFNPADRAGANGPGPRYLMGDRPEPVLKKGPALRPGQSNREGSAS